MEAFHITHMCTQTCSHADTHTHMRIHSTYVDKEGYNWEKL